MFSFQGAFEFSKKLNEVSVSRNFSQFLKKMVEISGIEPLTSCLQGRRSPSWAKPPYPSVDVWEVVGQNGLEPSTSRLSVVCSSQLSYWPVFASHFFWWRLAGSNRWPPACKAGALPAELNPQISSSILGTFYLYPVNWITRRFHKHFLTLGRYK